MTIASEHGPALVKRFYRETGIGAADGGHAVLLDGLPVRTPKRHPLVLPTEPLAREVTAEWSRQAETVKPHDMPLMRLATTVIDLMPERRDDAIAEIASYAESDLLCHRAEAPEALVTRQHAAWQPWLDWAGRRFDCAFVTSAGIGVSAQPETTLARIRDAVASRDHWRLVGLHATTTILGSVVLGLALAERELDVRTALDLSLLDELFTTEQWGLEEEQARRHARLAHDLDAAALFLEHLP